MGITCSSEINIHLQCTLTINEINAEFAYEAQSCRWQRALGSACETGKFYAWMDDNHYELMYGDESTGGARTESGLSNGGVWTVASTSRPATPTRVAQTSSSAHAGQPARSGQPARTGQLTQGRQAEPTTTRGGQRPGENCSFTPDTRVLMADGSTERIADIEVGDQVVTTTPETGSTAAELVTALHVNDDLELADVTVVNDQGRREVIHTTQNHEFWDATARQWVPAGELEPGHRLHTPQGTVTVDKVQAFTKPERMYNLTVEDTHTYYVVAGTTPVLVHNCGDARFAVGNDGVATDLHGTIDANRVRFTQNSAANTTRDGRSVADMANGLADGSISPSSIPPIRVFERNGELFSLDNRRLFAGQYAGAELPYRIATPAEIARRGMSYVDGGRSIKIRGIGWWSTG